MSARMVKLIAAVLGLLAFPMVQDGAAQEPGRLVAEAAVGWVGFADDGIVSESLVGASARWYVSPRLSVGPEVIYINGNNHSHLAVTGDVTFDIVAGVNGSRPRRVTPFVVIGGGLFSTRETFVLGRFTATEGAFTAGGGVRAFVSDSVTVGVETRVGWEAHLRVNASVGVRLRK